MGGLMERKISIKIDPLAISDNTEWARCFGVVHTELLPNHKGAEGSKCLEIYISEAVYDPDATDIYFIVNLAIKREWFLVGKNSEMYELCMHRKDSYFNWDGIPIIDIDNRHCAFTVMDNSRDDSEDGSGEPDPIDKSIFILTMEAVQQYCEQFK